MPQSLTLITADQIQTEPIHWIWKPMLAKGIFHILGGQPGTGKTTIAVDLIASITTGKAFPDGSSPDMVGEVIFWSDEDSKESVLKPRLIAAGADLLKVHFFKEDLINPAKELKRLSEVVESDNIQLIVFDSIMSLIEGDSNKAADVRRSLNWLKSLAETQECAILGITHFTKGTANAPLIERITGSISFAAMPRIILVAAKDPRSSESLLFVTKSNIGPMDHGLTYEIEPVIIKQSIETTKIRWKERILKDASKRFARYETPTDGRLNYQAIEMLRELLQETDHSQTLIAQMKQAGFSEKQTRSASKHLPIEIIREQGNSTRWVYKHNIIKGREE